MKKEIKKEIKKETKEQRIKQLEQEIEQFDFQRMKRQELAQQTQMQLQRDLSDIHDGTLTRRGEIICLRGLIAEEEKEEKEKKEKRKKGKENGTGTP
jgi:TolA-binding protein